MAFSLTKFQGHKRWDKAVTSGLENLRSLVHENMIPALERCDIILSRLIGLARFHDLGDSMDLAPPQISRLMDIVSCLVLVCHKILLLVMEELESFAVFSSWLRLEIDKLAASSISEELLEKEAAMDHAKVLAYIEQYLTTSPLGLYFDDVGKDDYTNDWKHADDGASLLDLLDKQIKRHESGQPHMKALPRVDFLVNYLTSRAGTIFKNIAEAEKRSVRFGQPTRLEIGDHISKYDIHMCANRKVVSLQTWSAVFDVILTASDRVVWMG
jgi:anaphase-promoting complex subunit 4